MRPSAVSADGDWSRGLLGSSGEFRPLSRTRITHRSPHVIQSGFMRSSGEFQINV